MTDNPADQVRARHAVPQPAAPRRNRRSIRLFSYDYSQNGAYFVTVCTQNRECLFGEVVHGEMRLNHAGQIANQCWRNIPTHFPHVDIDEFILMPNHIHGILVIDGRGTACRAPTGEQFGKPVSGSIPTIIRSFKSAATKRVNESHGTPGTKLWQRNYYEHIIRDDDELNRIRQYILDNPAQWETTDRENANALQKAATVKRNFEELGI